jgi:hypothetical protein
VSDATPPEPPASLDGVNLKWETWSSGTPIQRCYPSLYGAGQFNDRPDGEARFRPVIIGGRVVPVLYGADSVEGALAETVFHDVLDGSERRVFLRRFRTWSRSSIAPTRDLRLIQLYGWGLRPLGVEKRHLIETGREAYPYTARWARLLYEHPGEADGLIWASRLYDVAKAMVLFGTRVPQSAFEVVAPQVPLAVSPGVDEVRRAASEANILLVEELL